jgi:hypothetical protein
MQTRINHFHAGIAECGGNNFGPPVMTIETGLGD